MGLVQAQNGLSHTKSEAHLMIETQPIRSLIKLDGTTVEIIARADCQNLVFLPERRRKMLSSGGSLISLDGTTVEIIARADCQNLVFCLKEEGRY